MLWHHKTRNPGRGEDCSCRNWSSWVAARCSRRGETMAVCVWEGVYPGVQNRRACGQGWPLWFFRCARCVYLLIPLVDCLYVLRCQSCCCVTDVACLLFWQLRFYFYLGMCLGSRKGPRGMSRWPCTCFLPWKIILVDRHLDMYPNQQFPFLMLDVAHHTPL